MIGMRALDDKEIELIKYQLSSIHRCIFIVGLKTGFRISEILSIQYEDVLEESGEIKHEIHLKKRNTKGKTRGRVMPLHDEVRAELARWILKTEPRRGKLFPVCREAFHHAIKKACEKSGVDKNRVASHACRKTYAKKMYEALNQDVIKLQRAMGHASLSSTSAYIEVNWDEIADVIRKLK